MVKIHLPSHFFNYLTNLLLKKNHFLPRSHSSLLMECIDLNADGKTTFCCMLETIGELKYWYVTLGSDVLNTKWIMILRSWTPNRFVLNATEAQIGPSTTCCPILTPQRENLQYSDFHTARSSFYKAPPTGYPISASWILPMLQDPV